MGILWERFGYRASFTLPDQSAFIKESTMGDDLTQESDRLYLPRWPLRNRSEMWVRPSRNLDWTGIAHYSKAL